MRIVLFLVLTLAAAGCAQPAPKDTGPEPLPAHPAGTVSKSELPAPAR